MELHEVADSYLVVGEMLFSGIEEFRDRLLAGQTGRVLMLLGGSGVVISGVISPIIGVISIVTLLLTTHEPPSRDTGDQVQEVLF